jgi:hemerythrin-like domain-containing protein
MALKTAQAEAVRAFAEHEHRDLARGIDRIHDVACEIGRRPTPELSVDLLDVLRWLDLTLAQHIAWEEGWLYPEIDARLGTPWATRAARFDHRQIRDTATRLHADHGLLSTGQAGSGQTQARCHLFGLEALLRAHLEREERYLLPLLDEDLAGSQAEDVTVPLPSPA